MDFAVALITVFLPVYGFSAMHLFKNLAASSSWSADASTHTPASSGFSDDTTWVFVNGVYMPEIPSAAPRLEVIGRTRLINFGQTLREFTDSRAAPPPADPVVLPFAPAYWHITVDEASLTTLLLCLVFFSLVAIPFCRFCWTLAGQLIDDGWAFAGEPIEDDEPAVPAAEQHTCDDQHRRFNNAIQTLASLCVDAFGKAANASHSGFVLVAEQINRMRLAMDRLAEKISDVQSLAISASRAILKLEDTVHGLSEEVTGFGTEMMDIKTDISTLRGKLRTSEEAITELLAMQITELKEQSAQDLETAIDKATAYLSEVKNEILSVQQSAIEDAVTQVNAQGQVEFDAMKQQMGAEIADLRDQLYTATQTQAEAFGAFTSELEANAENMNAYKASMELRLKDIVGFFHNELDKRACRCSSSDSKVQDAATQTCVASVPPPADTFPADESNASTPSADQPKVEIPPNADTTADTSSLNALPSDIVASPSSAIDIRLTPRVAPTITPSKPAPTTEEPKKVQSPAAPLATTSPLTGSDLSRSRWATPSVGSAAPTRSSVSRPAAPTPSSHQPKSTAAGPPPSTPDLSSSRWAKSDTPAKPILKSTDWSGIPGYGDTPAEPTPAPTAESSQLAITTEKAKKVDSSTSSAPAAATKTAPITDLSKSRWAKNSEATPTQQPMKSTGWTGIAGYGNNPTEPTSPLAPRIRPVVADLPPHHAKSTASTSSTAGTDLGESRWAPKTATPAKPAPLPAARPTVPDVTSHRVAPVIAQAPATSTGLATSRHAPAGLSTSRHAPVGPAPTPTRASQQTTVAGPSTPSTAASTSTISFEEAKRLRKLGRDNEIPYCVHEANGGVCPYHAAARTKGSRKDCQWRHRSDEKGVDK